MRVGVIGTTRAAILLLLAVALQTAGNVCLSMGMKHLGSTLVCLISAGVALASTSS